MALLVLVSDLTRITFAVSQSIAGSRLKTTMLVILKMRIYTH